MLSLSVIRFDTHSQNCNQPNAQITVNAAKVMMPARAGTLSMEKPGK
jgi:hypothetical protein